VRTWSRNNRPETAGLLRIRRGACKKADEKGSVPDMTSRALISVVTPFYNEEATVVAFHDRMTAVVDAIPGVDFEFICVNDGSRDATLARLMELARRDARVLVVDLSRNFGKEAALTAGLDEASGDAVIPIDADLQDPPELIAEMIAQWRQGFEVVMARRVDRQADSFLKRKTAELFYRVHNSISDTAIPEDIGDFRLMDRAVVAALKLLPERRRFMKGLFAWVGFKATTIDYTRAARVAGSTKFTGWRLWNFALEGVTSFSTIPLRMWTYIGSLIALSAFGYAIYIVLRTLVSGNDVPGYASLVTVILFLGGVQLIGIGVVGEYIGRIYTESKQRPVYIVRQRFRKPGSTATGDQ
jgi:polyisoprenyl-phosphate glycosyltransferase